MPCLRAFSLLLLMHWGRKCGHTTASTLNYPQAGGTRPAHLLELPAQICDLGYLSRLEYLGAIHPRARPPPAATLCSSLSTGPATGPMVPCRHTITPWPAPSTSITLASCQPKSATWATSPAWSIWTPFISHTVTCPVVV